jgi:hypothetical protein
VRDVPQHRRRRQQDGAARRRGSKLTAAEIKAWITNPDPLTEKLATKPKIKMKKYNAA